MEANSPVVTGLPTEATTEARGETMAAATAAAAALADDDALETAGVGFGVVAPPPCCLPPGVRIPVGVDGAVAVSRSRARCLPAAPGSGGEVGGGYTGAAATLPAPVLALADCVRCSLQRLERPRRKRKERSEQNGKKVYEMKRGR